MFELSIQKAFRRHDRKMEEISEDENGKLFGGFSNFPKSVAAENAPPMEPFERSDYPIFKTSRFNSFIPFEEKILGYNSYTKRFLVMDPVLLDLLNAAVLEEDLEGLYDLHPTFFAELVKHDFIIKKEVDELQKVIDLRESVDFDDTSYHMTINPTMNCNFKCWYCYESHIKGSKMDQPTMEKIRKHIDKAIEDNPNLKHFHISWFGGEPMLYYDNVVEPIVSYGMQQTKARGIKFSSNFTTNGYLVRERMIPFFKENNINAFQITLDGNKEKHNTVRYTASKKGSYDKIIENIKLLVKNEIITSVRINYTKETLEKIEELITEFSDLTEEDRSYISFSFHNVWQDGDPNREKLEQVVTNFRRHDFNTNSLYSTFNTVRDSCYADQKNHVTINYDGEVFKCTARDFNKDDREGVMHDDGKIVWNEKFEQRMDSKFKNNPCFSCRIQPICNGGCSQQALEHVGEDYCVVDGDEREKDNIILSQFKQILEHQIIRRAKLVRQLNKNMY
ncbi:MAG: radical SAM protein [Bacteroidota bacterium]